MLYHYESPLAGEQMRARDYRVAMAGDTFDLDIDNENRKLSRSA